jgi:hypothetical protein
VETRGAPRAALTTRHLATVDDISFEVNPSKLLEEANVGCIRRSYGPDRMQGGRAVIIPAGVDENNTVALDAVFLSGALLH